MSFKNSSIVSLVFVLGVIFLVLSVPQYSLSEPIPPPESDCCISGDGPGCDDRRCEDIVCSMDAFCCETDWDGKCASQAEEFCTVCGGEPVFIRNIPTLNQWGLIALAGIMGLAALYILIRRNPVKSG